MNAYTPHQARYFAEQISLKRPESTAAGLASTMSGVKVDLNPHQVDAALFAMKSPLSSGALLADEVGLGKTVEASWNNIKLSKSGTRLIKSFDPGDLLNRINFTLNRGEVYKTELVKMKR